MGGIKGLRSPEGIDITLTTSFYVYDIFIYLMLCVLCLCFPKCTVSWDSLWGHTYDPLLYHPLDDVDPMGYGVHSMMTCKVIHSFAVS